MEPSDRQVIMDAQLLADLSDRTRVQIVDALGVLAGDRTVSVEESDELVRQRARLAHLLNRCVHDLHEVSAIVHGVRPASDWLVVGRVDAAGVRVTRMVSEGTGDGG